MRITSASTTACPKIARLPSWLVPDKTYYFGVDTLNPCRDGSRLDLQAQRASGVFVRIASLGAGPGERDVDLFDSYSRPCSDCSIRLSSWVAMSSWLISVGTNFRDTCSALIRTSAAVNEDGIISVSLATTSQVERTRATVQARARRYDWIDVPCRRRA